MDAFTTVFLIVFGFAVGFVLLIAIVLLWLARRESVKLKKKWERE